MRWSKVFATLIVSGLLPIGFFCLKSFCQSSRSPEETARPSEESKFLTAIEAEEKKGAYVFYTQTFIDEENKKVSYRGSIYGAIKTAKLEGCSLAIDVLILDKFSGLVGKKQTRDQEDSQLYSVRFTLSSEIANTLELVEARPVQLADGTNTVCVEKPSCAFTWLAIKSKDPAIRERRITNELIDFDGQTDRFLVPMSSSDSGKQLIEIIQSLADVQCKALALSAR
jgi:hypothetical protein